MGFSNKSVLEWSSEPVITIEMYFVRIINLWDNCVFQNFVSKFSNKSFIIDLYDLQKAVCGYLVRRLHTKGLSFRNSIPGLKAF